MVRDLTKPLLWNRSFFAWINLLMSLTAVIIAINSLSYVWVVFLVTFLAGFCFQVWLCDDLYQRMNKLFEETLKLSKKLAHFCDRQSSYIKRMIAAR